MHLEQDGFTRPTNLRWQSHDITDKWVGQTGAVVASHTVTASPRAFTIMQGPHFFFFSEFLLGAALHEAGFITTH